MELAKKNKIQSLTIRSLAEAIEYSPATIYEYFENKDVSIRELGSQFCADLLIALQSIPKAKNPETYLMDLIKGNTNFLIKKASRN